VKAQILVAVILVGANSAFPQSGFRSENPARHTTAPHRFFPGAFPWFLGDYGYGYDGYSSAPSMVMLPQPPLYVLMPPVPAEPPRPEIHEYQSSAPTANEDQTFAIVLRDGSTHSAVVTAPGEITSHNQSCVFQNITLCLLPLAGYRLAVHCNSSRRRNAARRFWNGSS